MLEYAPIILIGLVVVLVLVDSVKEGYNDELVKVEMNALQRPYHSTRVQSSSLEFQRLAVQNLNNQNNLPDNFNADINDAERGHAGAGRVPQVGKGRVKSEWGDESIEFSEPILHQSWLPFFRTRYDPFVLKMSNRGFQQRTPVNVSDVDIRLRKDQPPPTQILAQNT